MLECRNSGKCLSGISIFTVVNWVCPASAFRHQGQSGTASHGLVRHRHSYGYSVILSSFLRVTKSKLLFTISTSNNLTVPVLCRVSKWQLIFSLASVMVTHSPLDYFSPRRSNSSHLCWYLTPAAKSLYRSIILDDDILLWCLCS